MVKDIAGLHRPFPACEADYLDGQSLANYNFECQFFEESD